jgi:hypothetical protein
MAMNNLMNNTVRLVKCDGRSFEEIRASVQPGKIFTADAQIPIEEGDIFERDLPSGITEKYRVTDAGFYDAIGGIPAHYQSRVEKFTPLGTTKPPQQVIYNLMGENARINIQSHDASTNVVSVQPDQFFQQLRYTISQALEDDSAKDEVLGTVDEMEKSQGTTGFLQKYQKFLSFAADHMTVVAPFMPALEQMLRSRM